MAGTGRHPGSYRSPSPVARMAGTGRHRNFVLFIPLAYAGGTAVLVATKLRLRFFAYASSCSPLAYARFPCGPVLSQSFLSLRSFAFALSNFVLYSPLAYATLLFFLVVHTPFILFFLY